MKIVLFLGTLLSLSFCTSTLEAQQSARYASIFSKGSADLGQVRTSPRRADSQRNQPLANWLNQG